MKTAHATHAEPDPDYRFTKLLPRKTTGPTRRDLTLECMVNNHRAPVSWVVGTEPGARELKEGQHGRILVEKDFIGHCRLIIKASRLEDAGVYRCRIDGTKSITKCSVTLEGSVFVGFD